MSTHDEDLQISEGELTVLTNDLDEAHHATLPAMHEAVAELSEQLRDATSAKPFNRRMFLLAGTAVGGTIALAACGSSSSGSAAKSTTTATDTKSSDSKRSIDLAVAGLAVGLENLAVKTYQTALTAAAAGKIGTVPPAVATFAKTVMAQHKDHAGAWNAVLKSAGRPAVTGVDTTVDTAVVQPGLAKVTNVGELAGLALTLENVAAATYLNGMQNALKMSSAIKIAASIQPVEMQHASILNLLLGNYPVPDGFATVTGARSPTDRIG